MSSSLPSQSNSSTPATFVVGPGQHAGTQQPLTQTSNEQFVDRRDSKSADASSERRQFGSSHTGLSEAGRELAIAIDQYKLKHHRRYITCDEMLTVIQSLGYTQN